VAALELFLKGEQSDSYRIAVYNDVQGKLQKTYERDAQSIFFFIHNGTYCAGGAPMTPAAIMNDGLFDISIYNQVMTFKRIYTEV